MGSSQLMYYFTVKKINGFEAGQRHLDFYHFKLALNSFTDLFKHGKKCIFVRLDKNMSKVSRKSSFLHLLDELLQQIIFTLQKL